MGRGQALKKPIALGWTDQKTAISVGQAWSHTGNFLGLTLHTWDMVAGSGHGHEEMKQGRGTGSRKAFLEVPSDMTQGYHGSLEPGIKGSASKPPA